MSLDGLRAWIGEVERKLGMRTRVFLALTVIAIGIGGAAIYLAIDARDNSVSESDVQALQERLESQIGTGGSEAGGVEVAQLEAELKALQSEVATLKGEGGKPQKGSGENGGSSKESGTPSGATGGAPSASELQEQFQEARERAEEAK